VFSFASVNREISSCITQQGHENLTISTTFLDRCRDTLPGCEIYAFEGWGATSPVNHLENLGQSWWPQKTMERTSRT